MVRVKICGITEKDDAFKAIKFGADALGFVFHKKSPRYVSPSRARNIISILPPFVTTVGIFANERLGAVNDIAMFTGLSAVQIHGDEDHHYCHRLKRYHFKIIKAFRVDATFNFDSIKRFDVDGILFDAYQENVFGGTGKTFNWQQLQLADIKRPFILSGGLNQENILDAVKMLNPYAVDVSSGIESEPGKKDHHKMQAFIQNAKISV
ncbi:MAG: phosphoribosylanthranilate isomerase [Candidatus Omnitrophota bacterium]